MSIIYKIKPQWNWFLQLGIVLSNVLGTSLLLIFVFSGNRSLAQITPDSTLPSSSVVTSSGNTETISGGTQVGSNLFHSFKEFSILTGSEAFFNNANDIQNIITRVTGGSISQIDGLIRANGIANLFLINPNGIVFGENARLDIGGSFIGSSANSLRFKDGTEFSANSSNTTPLLTISVPIGLQFASNPGAITVKGVGHDLNYEEITSRNQKIPRGRVNTQGEGLQVKPRQTLALFGGNIVLNGSILKAPSGRIEIVSAASNQSVSLQQAWKLSDEDRIKFGNIQFSGKSFVSTTGDGGGEIALAARNISLTQQSFLLADTEGSINGGGISIKGDSIVFDRSNISSNTYSTGNGGQIRLDAKNVTFENNSSVNTAAEKDTGSAGEININAGSLILKNRAGINTNTYDKGNAGRINIKADSLQLEGLDEKHRVGIGSLAAFASPGNAGDINIIVVGAMVMNGAGIEADSSATGNAGTIDIRANSLRTEKSGIQSRVFGTGKAGEIKIDVTDSLEILSNTGINSNTFGTGNAGNIKITANSLRIENSQVNSLTTNVGNAGTIILDATRALELRNKALINTSTTGMGSGGQINIIANSLRIDDKAGVFSVTSNTGYAGEININVVDSFQLQNQAFLSTETYGKGNAGNININANSLWIESAGVVSKTGEASTGNGGNINVKAAGGFTLKTASISTDALGTGDAGQITVTAEALKIRNSDRSNTSDNLAGIYATSTTGQGGNIQLNIGNLLLLRGRSSISTTAGTNQNSTGNGGNITINAPDGLIVAVKSENSDISANAYAGKGGRVNIVANGIFGIQPRLNPTPWSDITASSEFGVDGTVELNTPDINPSQGLVELPTNLVDVSQQIAQGCTPRNGQTSRFVAMGRGGLPLSPTEPLRQPAVITQWVTLDEQTGNLTDGEVKPVTLSKHLARDSQPIVEANGLVVDARGNVHLIAQGLNIMQSNRNIPSAYCAGS
ncbi:hypothetical protein NUACC21_47510 [Scytonema sp. NUACC21]